MRLGSHHNCGAALNNNVSLKDLAHPSGSTVARIISLKEMDSVRLPLAPPGQAAAASSSETTGASSKGCVFFYVSRRPRR